VAEYVWIAGVYLDNLKKDLDVRLAAAAETNVRVFTAPVGAQEMPNEAIVFIEVNTNEEVAALKTDDAVRNEEWSVIEGTIRVTKLQAASGEDAAVEARTRAITLLAHLEKEIRLNPNKTGTTAGFRVAYISSKRLVQGVDPIEGGRACSIDFDITVAVRTNVTA
jgi:hypothetical protein